MPQKDPGNDGPSLELPSFGLGRKRKAAEPSTDAVAEPPSEPPPEPSPEPPPEPTPVPAPVEPAAVDPVVVSEEAPGARKASRERRPPSVGGPVAAALTGLVVGLLMVGLSWGSLRLCEVARGTSSCGQPGLVVLLAILAVLVVVGRLLLRTLGIDDAGSISFLGVGVVAVVTLLFLVGALFQWWIVLVLPAVSVASFALAHWVSTAFVETPEGNLHR
jgi:hypothetical protein